MNPPKLSDPPEVVTFTNPVAPAPTTAIIGLSFITIKELAAIPPKVTAVAPLKALPLIVSFVPVEAGVLKEVIMGFSTGLGSPFF